MSEPLKARVHKGAPKPSFLLSGLDQACPNPLGGSGTSKRRKNADRETVAGPASGSPDRHHAIVKARRVA